MPFRVMARTVLQLGAELISSDGIAFYEIIKNAFDAGSPRVDIDVTVRMEQRRYQGHYDAVVAGRQNSRNSLFPQAAVRKAADLAAADLDPSAPGLLEVREAFGRATDWDELQAVLDSVNSIQFADTGTGMTMEDLDAIYLTIGTRNRLIQAQTLGGRRAGEKPVLGEKGIGRLAVMRLGWHTQVETSVAGELNWNVLEIPWRLFSHASDAEIGSIDIEPCLGAEKPAAAERGTKILVTGLASEWSLAKLEGIAREEFSKLTDPFLARTGYPISLRFNGRPVPIPRMDRFLFDRAHGVVSAKFACTENGPTFTGRIDYRLRTREKTFLLEGAELTSLTRKSASVLRSLGAFEVTFYWFNRKALEAVEGIGDKRAVQDLVNAWSGGLMLFRDGFRVNPYGSPSDDWLDLDRKALASAGYKVNRKQLVGKVDITRAENSALTDQTNREGLRDCDEKGALVALLKHLVEAQFRTFLNAVDEEVQTKEPLSLDELGQRVKSEERHILQSIRTLRERHPELLEQEAPTLRALEQAVERIMGLIKEADALAQSFAAGRHQLVSLAGLGLMVEIVAHELNRATVSALSTLDQTDATSLTPGVKGRLVTLKAQLKTLQKRLRVIDPLTQSGRQVKETFDLAVLVEEVLSSHDSQFGRHGIRCALALPAGGMQVKMVRGMVVQILENLLSNSVYWLKQQKRLTPDLSPRIEVSLNPRTKELRVTDNGPGIRPERCQEVFQAFVTSKPPGEGKGLGLFISREIAEYHDATLALASDSDTVSGRLNTFVLSLEVRP